MDQLEGKRILITGAGGQVAFPVACALARHNEVFGLARFTNPADRGRLEAAGVRCVAAELGSGPLDAVPEDLDYVLNFAVSKGFDPDFDRDITANAVGVGRLMSRCRRARALLHCSSTGVYRPDGQRRFRETDALGDSHHGFLPTYSIAKISAEAVARFAAVEFGLPTVIARLNVPYGDNGGWPAMHLDWMLAGSQIPIHPERPNLYNPIHDDDILAKLPRLLAIASVPVTIVNWGGVEEVSLEEWCEYLGGLVGVKPQLVENDRTIPSVAIDTTRMLELIGPTQVAWRDGMRRMVEARHPERLRRG